MEYFKEKIQIAKIIRLPSTTSKLNEALDTIVNSDTTLMTFATFDDILENNSLDRYNNYNIICTMPKNQ